MTHASIADMLYAECQISQLTQMCKDAGLPVGVDKDLTLKQSLAKRLADDGWGGDESMESEIEAVNADSRADDGNDGDDHGDDGYEQKICEAESEDLDGTADMHNQQQHGVEAATLQDFVADTCEDHCVCVAVYRTPRVEDLIVYRSGLQWQLGEVSSVTIPVFIASLALFACSPTSSNVIPVFLFTKLFANFFPSVEKYPFTPFSCIHLSISLLRVLPDMINPNASSPSAA